jgi:hypothetical protein
VDFGAGTPVTLHGKEAVITEADMKNGRGWGGGGTHVSIVYSPQLTFQGAGNQSEIIATVNDSLRNNADGLADVVAEEVSKRAA